MQTLTMTTKRLKHHIYEVDFVELTNHLKHCFLQLMYLVALCASAFDDSFNRIGLMTLSALKYLENPIMLEIHAVSFY